MAKSIHSSSLLDTSKLTGLANARIAIVYTEWNDKIVGEMVAGAEKVLTEKGITPTIKLAVPGSFELTYGCRKVYESLAAKGNAPEAIIAFGTVIQGGTPHFEYVCKSVTEGITQLNLTLPSPVIFGVLTLNNEQEAWERLGGPHGHKGEEAAITALKMIHNNRNLAE